MQQGLDGSLVKITKGAGITFAGATIGIALGFLGKLLVARYGTEAEYGVFSLAFVVLNICAVIATLGLQQGATRSIAFARGKNDWERVQQLIPASIQFGLLASILLCIIVFFASDIIAAKIFHDATLGFPLKIFAVAIPFFTLINVFVSIFRGFDDVKPRVYFQNILRGGLFLLFLLPIIFLNLPFNGVFFAFLASFMIACITFIIYAAKKLPSPIKIASRASANPVARELVFFSIPLLGASLLGTFIVWTDSLMLGYFTSSADVGLYNAAQPLARFLAQPLAAMLFIYIPIISGLYARGSMAEIRKHYTVLTKWLCSLTLPLFLILFLFPETVLNFLFGTGYAGAGNALRLLALGVIIDNLLGPNAATLISLGQPKFVMWANLVAVAVNVGLNVALIPPFGINGAAIAFIATITSGNLMRSWKLYSLSKAQPLSKNLLKPTLTSLALVSLIQLIFTHLVAVAWWMLPLLFILYYGIYGGTILLTKSFDQEDITMLLAIEKRAGINLSFAKKILRRFL